MADDIAVLGMSVQSNTVADGAADLNKLSAAAKGAEAAVRTFEQGATKATAATAQMSSQVHKATAFQRTLNERLNVKDTFDSGAVLAYGQELDALRAKLNPLFAVERQRMAQLAEIDMAARMGAISHIEHAAAIQRVDVAARLQTKAVQMNEKAILQAGKGALISGHAMSNLAFQVNDVATMAAMGMDPLRIMTSQLGQFYQILAMGEGGVTGSLKSLGGMFTSLLTPMRLLVGTAAGLGVTLGVAANAWISRQNEIQLALIGTGSAAGLTSASINQIVTAAHAAGQATVGEAEQMALALTATGRVNEEIMDRAISLSRNVQKVFGEDNAEAAARLAKALQDPAKGIDDLDRRLSAFDHQTAQHIKNLAAQGRFLEAQRLLLDGVARSTATASQNTSGWAQAWNSVRMSASGFWDTVSSGTADVLGVLSRQEELGRLQNDLIELIQVMNRTTNPGMRGAREQEARSLVARIRDLRAEVRGLDTDAAANRDSRALGDLIQQIVPDQSTLTGLENTLKRLQELAKTPGALAGLDAATRANFERALELQQSRTDNFQTEMVWAQAAHDLEMRNIASRTPGQHAQLAFEETLTRLRRNGVSEIEALTQAEWARTRVLTQASTEQRRSNENRLLSAQHNVSTARLELDVLGRTTAEQELQRGFLQNRNQLEQEALRTYGNREAYDRSHLAALDAETKLQADIGRLLREQSLARDLQFERDQLGRTGLEQDVYARLRSAGMLTNGEIKGAAAEAAAAQIRLNGVLRANVELSREAAGSFVKDLMAGKSAAEALSSALLRVADRLTDLAMDHAFQSIFGGAGGGNSFLSGLFGGGKGSAMGAPSAGDGGWGATVVPAFHKGGLVGANDNAGRVVSPSVFRGARRYHGGGVAGLASNEVPAILLRGERVLAPGESAGGGIVITVPVTIDARGAYPESIREIQAAVAGLERSMPARIVETIREANDRGVAA